MSKPDKTPLIIAAVLFIFALFLFRSALAMNPDNYEAINIFFALIAGIKMGCSFMLIGDYFDDQNKIMKEETKELIRQAYVNGYENGCVKGDWHGKIDEFYKENNL